METDNNHLATIGEIVANDFRTATIFKENNIDFCCGGKQSVEEACTEKGIDATVLYQQIRAMELSPALVTPAAPAETALLFLATLATQGSALVWSSEHRRHHAFVDTDDDPYSIPTAELKDMQAELTLLGGEVVFDRSALGNQ